MSANPVALAGLFAKYGSLKSVDVTSQVIRDITSALKFPVTEEGIALAVETIVSGDLENLADYVGQPERLKSLLSRAGGQDEKDHPLARCPHCSGLFEMHFEQS